MYTLYTCWYLNVSIVAHGREAGQLSTRMMWTVRGSDTVHLIPITPTSSLLIMVHSTSLEWRLSLEQSWKHTYHRTTGLMVGGMQKSSVIRCGFTVYSVIEAVSDEWLLCVQILCKHVYIE